ncbi:hypothetical protein ACH42_15985 [Endozoicomonas sp. (ex Bugula neritina AB1)]|nr:hypothetical protein ACH42_15985 [Endozoicomonas sp. (ex Bugula neritina AB1)]
MIRFKQAGLTLIELMITMLLGLFITTMVSQVFIRSNSSNILNHQLSLMQESARLAMNFIAKDVRMGGYTGCNKSTAIGNALSSNTAINEWAVSEHLVQGLDQLNTINQVDPEAQSESLLIFKLNPDQTFYITNHNTGSTTLTLDRNPGAIFPPGTAVGLTSQDCSQVALVAITNTNGNRVQHSTGSVGDFSNCFSQLRDSFRCYDSTSPGGSKNFAPGSLKSLRSVAYYIKPENGLPTLFRKTVGVDNPEPLVDGIEMISIYYGLDTDADGSAERFLNAGDRAFRHDDWHNITAIRIHLITRSEIEVTTTPRDYYFDGLTLTPSDLFLRKEYVLTLALRNQG